MLLTDYIEDFLRNADQSKSIKASFLREFYNDTEHEELTPELFAEKVKTGSKNFSDVLCFLRYLVEMNIVKDSRFVRLVDNIEAFGSHTPIYFAVVLLNVSKDDYDYFYENKYLETNSGRKILMYLYNGTEEIGLTSAISAACDKAIREIAFDDTFDIDDRYTGINRIYAFAETFLRDVTELSAETVSGFFRSVDKKDRQIKIPKVLTRGFVPTVFRVVNALYRQGNISDHNLSYFMEFLYPLLNTPNGMRRAAADYIEILTTKEIEKWVIINPVIYPCQLLIYVDIPDSNLRKDFITFLIQNCTSDVYSYKTLSGHFSESLEWELPQDATDLKYENLTKQLRFFLPYNSKTPSATTVTGVVASWYLYVWKNINNNLFSERSVTPFFLQKQGTIADISNGFEVYPYSNMEHYPEGDKWIICIGDVIQTNSDVSLAGSITLDFTVINFPGYRELAKNYMWYHPIGFSSKYNAYAQIYRMLNFFSGLKSDPTFTVYKSGAVHNFLTTEMYTINSNEAAAYSYWLRQQYDIKRLTACVHDVMPFLKFIADNKLCVIPPDIEKTITSPKSYHENNSKPVADEDAPKILKEMFGLKDDSIEYAMCFYAIMIMIYSDLRGKEILGLSANCLIDSIFPDKSYLKMLRKGRNKDPKRVAAVEKVKTCLELAKVVSAQYREDCSDESIKRLLFIVPDRYHPGLTRNLHHDRLNVFIAHACRNAGTKRYTYQSIRDLHMNKIDTYALMHGLDEFDRSDLSGHKSSSTDVQFYLFRKNLRKMLEKTYNLIIGHVDQDIYKIKGTATRFLDNILKKPEHLVQNDTGYCDNCEYPGYINCLICPKFATDITRKPEFERALKETQAAIKYAQTQHEMDDLTLLAKLYLMYIEQIILIEYEIELEKKNA